MESPILTRKVWDELFDLFKLHFSTEMPFLHPFTFRQKLRLAAYPRDQAIIPEPDRLLLLGVLALTARFHPALVSHHSDQGHPMAASEIYAKALASAVGSIPIVMTQPSLERIQALLMLSLYSWGQSYGLSAWQYLGIAIRLAQSMKLEYEDDPNEQPPRLLRENSSSRSTSEVATEKEVRRRTLWSCFIMDRSLSGGKTSPSGMDKERLRVRLPCSENNFLFVADVRTGFLNTEWLRTSHGIREQLINDDGVLSRHVRLKEIFGRCAEWSYPGGRRTEQHPPWDKRSKVFKLQQDLDHFHATLPSNLVFTQANLSAHIEQRNATPYASMHVLYFLCLIMLHREYIPFIAFECKNGPEGPLDEPTFPKNVVPQGFWENSAERVFSSARDIVTIVTICQESNALPESPLFIFAVYQATYVALYAYYFPNMDVEGHISCPRNVHNREIPEKDHIEPTKRILRGFALRSRMAKFYVGFLRDNRNPYEEELTYYLKYGKTQKKGGLGIYIHMEKDHKEFGGRPEDSERNIPSDGSDSADHPPSRGSTNEYQSHRSNAESVETSNAVRSNTNAWAAVNQTPPDKEDRHAYHEHRPFFQPSPKVSSTAPSLISPSVGDSTPSVQSPYSAHQSTQYYQSSQLSHAAMYTSSAPLTMPPPDMQNEVLGIESDYKNDASMTTYPLGQFDQFAQIQYPYDFPVYTDVPSNGQYNNLVEQDHAYPVHNAPAYY